jgi:hypothetical protein
MLPPFPLTLCSKETVITRISSRTTGGTTTLVHNHRTTLTLCSKETVINLISSYIVSRLHFAAKKPSSTSSVYEPQVERPRSYIASYHGYTLQETVITLISLRTTGGTTTLVHSIVSRLHLQLRMTTSCILILIYSYCIRPLRDHGIYIHGIFTASWPWPADEASPRFAVSPATPWGPQLAYRRRSKRVGRRNHGAHSTP